MAQVCRALDQRNTGPTQAGRWPSRRAPSAAVSSENRAIGRITVNRQITTASTGQPWRQSTVVLEIRRLCSSALNRLVVMKRRPLAGSSISSAAAEMARAASRLRPVNRSRPTPQAAQSSTPQWRSGMAWIVPQCLHPRTCDAFNRPTAFSRRPVAVSRS